MVTLVSQQYSYGSRLVQIQLDPTFCLVCSTADYVLCLLHDDRVQTNTVIHSLGPFLTKKKNVTIRDILNMTKYHDSWHSIPNENNWSVTFYVTFRDIFSKSKNPIFQIKRFLRVGLLSEVGSSRPEPTAPGPARARPSGWYFQNHGLKPDQVREIPIPRDVGPVRPASFQSHWSSARPGPWDSQNIFAVSSCCCVSSRFRGSNVLVSPGPAASLRSRSLSTSGIRSRVCHAPIPAFGYRWCGVGYVVPWSGIFQATTKCLESWFCFFQGKAKKFRSWFMIVCRESWQTKSRFRTKIVISFFVRNGP